MVSRSRHPQRASAADDDSMRQFTIQVLVQSVATLSSTARGLRPSLKLAMTCGFRRIQAQEGVRLVSSSDSTEVNPDLNKYIVDGDFGAVHKDRVEGGWVLLGTHGSVRPVLRYHRHGD